MTLLLDANDLRLALPYALAVSVIEAGFRAFAAGDYVMPQRLMLSTNGNFLATMPVADRTSMSVKIATVTPRNTGKGLPTVQAVVVLLEGMTGEVISVLDGTSLTVIRTSATSAAATKLLANSGPIQLGVLGTGPQAIRTRSGPCGRRGIGVGDHVLASSQREVAVHHEGAGRAGDPREPGT